LAQDLHCAIVVSRWYQRTYVAGGSPHVPKLFSTKHLTEGTLLTLLYWEHTALVGVVMALNTRGIPAGTRQASPVVVLMY